MIKIPVFRLHLRKLLLTAKKGKRKKIKLKEKKKDIRKSKKATI